MTETDPRSDPRRTMPPRRSWLWWRRDPVVWGGAVLIILIVAVVHTYWMEGALGGVVVIAIGLYAILKHVDGERIRQGVRDAQSRKDR